MFCGRSTSNMYDAKPKQGISEPHTTGFISEMEHGVRVVTVLSMGEGTLPLTQTPCIEI